MLDGGFRAWAAARPAGQHRRRHAGPATSPPARPACRCWTRPAPPSWPASGILLDARAPSPVPGRDRAGRPGRRPHSRRAERADGRERDRGGRVQAGRTICVPGSRLSACGSATRGRCSAGDGPPRSALLRLGRHRRARGARRWSWRAARRPVCRLLVGLDRRPGPAGRHRPAARHDGQAARNREEQTDRPPSAPVRLSPARSGRCCAHSWTSTGTRWRCMRWPVRRSAAAAGVAALVAVPAGPGPAHGRGGAHVVPPGHQRRGHSAGVVGLRRLPGGLRRQPGERRGGLPGLAG